MPSATSTKRDYYEVLGVERSATVVEIKKSYRKLAMKFHPDRNGGDPEADTKFRECAEAYEVLSDDQKRARYDQFGHDGVQGAAHDFRHADVGDIFSMFQDIFGPGFGGMGGGRGRRAGPRPGADLETQVELTLEEVAAGAEKTLEFDRLDRCETCDGRGLKKGATPKPCATCNGQGRIAQQGLGGMFRMVTACPTCRGTGVLPRPEDLCPTCEGTGRVQVKRTVQVRIPAGVHEGQAVRLTGEGEPAPTADGQPGDLICYVAVRDHAVFSRHDRDLVCQVPVSFTTAALGGSIDVPTLAKPDDSANIGQESLDIRAGTQHGEVFKLRGQGLPDVRGLRRGDLMVQVLVEIPKKLSQEQQDLLRQFAETEDDHHHHSAMPQRKGFLDKLKSMLAGD
ncbi:MAG: molecular chaperone DnaJ [Planctomycetota bacterium]